MTCQKLSLLVRLLLAALLSSIYCKAEETREGAFTPKIVYQGLELLRADKNSSELSRSNNENGDPLRGDESSHYAVFDAKFLLDLFSNGEQKESGEIIKEIIEPEARPFTGIGRPKNFLPPGQKRRRKLFKRLRNKAQPQTSSKTHVFARQESDGNFGLNPLQKKIPKQLRSKGQISEEGNLFSIQLTTRKPITIAPPKYKPGPAIVKATPDLEDLKRGGIISNDKFNEMKTGRSFDHTSPSDILKVKESLSFIEPDHIRISSSPLKSLSKPTTLFHSGIFENHNSSADDHMALYVESAYSPTYTIPSQPRFLMGHLGHFEFRKYNVSALQSRQRSHETRFPPSQKRQMHLDTSSPVPVLSPTASSFIHPTSPPPYIHPGRVPSNEHIGIMHDERPSHQPPHMNHDQFQNDVHRPFPNRPLPNPQNQFPVGPVPQDFYGNPFSQQMSHNDVHGRPHSHHENQKHHGVMHRPSIWSVKPTFTKPLPPSVDHIDQSLYRPNDVYHGQLPTPPPHPHYSQQTVPKPTDIRIPNFVRPTPANSKPRPTPPAPSPPPRPHYSQQTATGPSDTYRPSSVGPTHTTSKPLRPTPSPTPSPRPHYSLGPTHTSSKPFHPTPPTPSPPPFHPTTTGSPTKAFMPPSIVYEVHQPDDVYKITSNVFPEDMIQVVAKPNRRPNSYSPVTTLPPLPGATHSTPFPSHAENELPNSVTNHHDRFPPPVIYDEPPQEMLFIAGPIDDHHFQKIDMHDHHVSHMSILPPDDSIVIPTYPDHPISTKSYQPTTHASRVPPAQPHPVPSTPKGPVLTPRPTSPTRPPHHFHQSTRPKDHPTFQHHQFDQPTRPIDHPTYQNHDGHHQNHRPTDHPTYQNHDGHHQNQRPTDHPTFQNHDGHHQNQRPIDHPTFHNHDGHHQNQRPIDHPTFQNHNSHHQNQRPIDHPTFQHHDGYHPNQLSPPTFGPVLDNSHAFGNPYNPGNFPDDHFWHNPNHLETGHFEYSKRKPGVSEHANIKPFHVPQKPTPSFVKHTRFSPRPTQDSRPVHRPHKPGRQRFRRPQGQEYTHTSHLNRPPRPQPQPQYHHENSRPFSNEVPGRIPGVPGLANRDYPIYSAVPRTSFTCEGRVIGYYADQEAKCQVFHMCHNGNRQSSFLCPNGTLFSQEVLTCDHWRNVDCQRSSKLYHINKKIYNFQDKKTYRNRWKKHAKQLPHEAPENGDREDKQRRERNTPTPSISATPRPVLLDERPSERDFPFTKKMPDVVGTTRSSTSDIMLPERMTKFVDHPKSTTAFAGISKSRTPVVDYPKSTKLVNKLPKRTTPLTKIPRSTTAVIELSKSTTLFDEFPKTTTPFPPVNLDLKRRENLVHTSTLPPASTRPPSLSPPSPVSTEVTSYSPVVRSIKPHVVNPLKVKPFLP